MKAHHHITALGSLLCSTAQNAQLTPTTFRVVTTSFFSFDAGVPNNAIYEPHLRILFRMVRKRNSIATQLHSQQIISFRRIINLPPVRCQKCGSLLEAQILGNICPACLWSDLMNEEETERQLQEDGPVIEGHKVFEEIGQGGMGLVYRARQEQPSREVALKIVAPYTLRAEEARKRFFLEIEAMAAIEHPAVLPLYQSGEDAFGRPWLTMQLLRGGSLADNLSSYQGRWKESVQLVSQLCEAIAYAHEHGLLHRDLKPANVLFDLDGNPFVADFGLAKWAEGDSQISQSSCLLGSPAYLAPEAAEGGSKLTTTVSDVYGLGSHPLRTPHRPPALRR